MCGLIGGFGKDASFLNEEILRSSGGLMSYRGPDATNFFQNGKKNFSVLHHRLGIIGLNSKFDQPYQKNSSVLAFNGEIYNFRDRSTQYTSDTDFLSDELSTLGSKCLEKHVGMYAGVFFKDNKVTIFRDFYGKKPLYISRENGLTLFSSEVIPLMNLRSRIGLTNTLSSASVSSYLLGGSVHGFNTLIEEIDEFNSNTRTSFDVVSSEVLDSQNIFLETEATNSPPEAEFSDIFSKAVEERSFADHPMAHMFSGGIDSLAVACALQNKKSDITLFTLASEHNRDEVNVSIAAAKKLKMKQLVVDAPVYNSQDTFNSLAKLDHPSADSSFINIIGIMDEISKDFRVCLSGDGGDELLGGYAHYNWMRKRTLNLNSTLLVKLENILQVFPKQKLTTTLLSALSNSYAAKQFYSRIISSGQAKSMYLRFDTDARVKRDAFYDSFMSKPIGNIIQQVTQADMQTSLRELILHKVDRGSMLRSVEVRSPLLDSRLFQWRSEMLKNNKWSQLDHKLPLKKIIAGTIGTEFLRLPKTGFGVDIKKICEDLLEMDEVKTCLKNLERYGLDVQESISRINYGGPALKNIYSLIVLSIWLERVTPYINYEQIH